MRKSILVLFSVLMVLALAASGGCASAGYTGLVGLSVLGYEVAGVVAANQAMIGSIAGQQGWLPYGQQFGQYGNVPVCRLQDLVGLPLISVSQPVIVRVPKSKGHRAADIVGGAAIGAGLGWLNGGAKAVAVGTGAGAGGGLLVANHEPTDLCLLLPVKAMP